MRGQLEKRKLDIDEMGINPISKVKVTTMNHIVEVQYLSNENTKQRIQKLDAERYVNLETGEVSYFDRKENRGQAENSLRKTFRRLRELINTNFTGSANELFVTLTYAEQTNNVKQVYKDFVNFMKRLKYKYKSVSSVDYINVLEPHASGNFHMHALLRFNDMSNVYIENSVLAELWGLGFVTIQSLRNVDNIGAYVSAYLTDIEVTDTAEGYVVEEKQVQGGNTKKFVKGGRLHFYPTGVNIYRKSKGIVEPVVEKMTYKKAQKKLGEATPNFKYGVEISDPEKEFSNTIIKEQYNLKRKR